MNSSYCVDIDECQEEPCDQNAECSNSQGSFSCSCNSQYLGDGFRCLVDNCATGLHNCHAYATCNNVHEIHRNNAEESITYLEKHRESEPPGIRSNFSCACSAGYVGDGVSCSKATVLVLGPYYSQHLLVDANGRHDTVLLGYSDVYLSCSVTYRGKFYIFGGSEQNSRQIIEVKGCSLSRIGTLDFDHYIGACSNVDDRQIYLCFDEKDTKQCRSAVEPLGTFTKIEQSSYGHSTIRTAASPSSLNSF